MVYLVIILVCEPCRTVFMMRHRTEKAGAGGRRTSTETSVPASMTYRPWWGCSRPDRRLRKGAKKGKWTLLWLLQQMVSEHVFSPQIVRDLYEQEKRHGINRLCIGCWFGIVSMTVTYQFRAGSGFWTIIGCLVVPGWRSWWYTAVRSRSGAHSSRRSYARVLFSEVSRMSSLLNLPLPCGWET